MDPEGGHVPFTHHVPVVTVDELDNETIDSREISDDGGPTEPNGHMHERESSVSTPSHERKEEERGKRHRLSLLFHRKKRSSEALTRSESTKVIKKPKEDKVDSDRAEREEIMRRKEHERRETELAQGTF